VSEFADFGNLAEFSNLSDVLNDAKFRSFLRPVKIRGGAGEIPIPIVEALPTTDLRNTFDGRRLRGC